MGIFGIFKKKKKQLNALVNTKEDLQWNKMWELWGDGKIESPYQELMEYFNGINNSGHYMHFDNIAGNQDLKTYIDALTTILPQPLKENVELAYRTYMMNPDDVSDEDNEILDQCDDVYYTNEYIMNNILKERASKIDL